MQPTAEDKPITKTENKKQVKQVINKVKEYTIPATQYHPKPYLFFDEISIKQLLAFLKNRCYFTTYRIQIDWLLNIGISVVYIWFKVVSAVQHFFNVIRPIISL